MKRDINKTVASLQDERASLADIRVASLSDLSREEQGVMAGGWTSIPLDKRRELLTVLDEAAGADFRMEFSAIFRIALTDCDARVRRLAIDGLWMDENPSIVRPLLTLVSHDDDVEVRASAADALGAWVLRGEYEEIDNARALEIVDTLIDILSDAAEPLAVRARALESVGYSHDERVPPLIERIYAAPDLVARRSALKAMGRHGDDRWTATVRGQLRNDDPDFRLEAVRAVGEMSDRGATARLIALVRDREREIRELAVWALGEVGGKQAETALKQLIQGDDPAMRRLARAALTELKMLDETDEMSGLVLFDFEPEEALEEDEPLPGEEDDDFLSVVIDSEWVDDLDSDDLDDLDLDEEEDGAWLEEDDEDEDEEEWYSDDEEELEPFEDDGDEPDLSFLEDDEDARD